MSSPASTVFRNRQTTRAIATNIRQSVQLCRFSRLYPCVDVSAKSSKQPRFQPGNKRFQGRLKLSTVSSVFIKKSLRTLPSKRFFEKNPLLQSGQPFACIPEILAGRRIRLHKIWLPEKRLSVLQNITSCNKHGRGKIVTPIYFFIQISLSEYKRNLLYSFSKLDFFCVLISGVTKKRTRCRILRQFPGEWHWVAH